MPDVKNLLTNFNSSQMLEFDDSLFLFSEAHSTMDLTTRIIFLSSQLVCMEILSLIFEILNGSLVKFVNSDSSNFISIGISFLILRSQTSPHVMYTSAVWFLGLSRGIGSHI